MENENHIKVIFAVSIRPDQNITDNALCMGEPLERFDKPLVNMHIVRNF